MTPAIVITVILGAAGVLLLGMEPKNAFIASGLLVEVVALLIAPCPTTEEGDSSYNWVLLLALFSVAAGAVLWFNLPYQFMIWSAVVLFLNGWKGVKSLGATTNFGKSPGSRTVHVRDAGVIQGVTELLSIFYIVTLVVVFVWYLKS